LNLLVPAIDAAGARGLIPKESSWSFVINEIIGYDVMPLNLRGVDLRSADLEEADLRAADCAGADFSGATLRNAQLGHANLSWARFIGADLTGASVRAAQLTHAVLLRTRVEGADFGYCHVYGISAWDLTGTAVDENELLVTPPGEARLRTDSLSLAQLMYFLSRREHARDVIDALSRRIVLVLGNFKSERKAILRVIGGELRRKEFLPMIFDFAGPAHKDTTGTVETLARLASFIVADLTDPSSVPHELATTVPFLRTTPVVLLRELGASGYSMVDDLQAYPWVLEVQQYGSPELLVRKLPDIIREAQSLSGRLQRLGSKSSD
jgi:hypothetical protein